MKHRKETSSSLNLAVEASEKLWSRGFLELRNSSESEALVAHAEIESTRFNGRNSRFYGRFVPLLTGMVTLLGESYRRYFKLGLAHTREVGSDAHYWALNQLQPGVNAVLEWIGDWYTLACDGENRYVQRVGSIPFVPGETGSLSIPTIKLQPPQPKPWCAPAWLFWMSPLVGISGLKTKHIPETDSDKPLSAALTRLLFKGVRRVLLWRLRAEIENVRNEETVAAGAVAPTTVQEEIKTNKRRIEKRRPKRFDGLGEKKADLSEYTDVLTEKQKDSFSLKYEYGLGTGEIASRMELDRKTVYEHIEAADRKVNQAYSNDRRKARSVKEVSE
jgi:DNA-directed RNA polymerase specialized sigma24 family protein